MPTVSVIMPVYNGEKYLREAIRSILEQTYNDFELIIIDDCSTDSSVDIIKSFSDSRINLISNEKNMKLPYSLNRGMKLAKGKYIARMDADDISIPNRFKMQVDYLEKHSEVAVVGGCFQVIDEDGNQLYIRRLLRGDKLIKYRLMPSPMAHPTVMMRKEVIINNNYFYNEKYSSAQDYDLWLRIARKYKIDNLPDVLLYYRVHGNSITETKKKEQQDNTYKIFSQNSPVPISYVEFLAILHRSYIISPWHQSRIMYKVFRTIDYMYWRNVLGYTVRYIMKKFK